MPVFNKWYFWKRESKRVWENNYSSMVSVKDTQFYSTLYSGNVYWAVGIGKRNQSCQGLWCSQLTCRGRWAVEHEGFQSHRMVSDGDTCCKEEYKMSLWEREWKMPPKMEVFYFPLLLSAMHGIFSFQLFLKNGCLLVFQEQFSVSDLRQQFQKNTSYFSTCTSHSIPLIKKYGRLFPHWEVYTNFIQAMTVSAHWY